MALSSQAAASHKDDPKAAANNDACLFESIRAVYPDAPATRDNFDSMQTTARFALCSSLALVGCGADDEPEQPAPNAFQAFDDTVESYLASNGIAGATAVVVDQEDGVLHLRGYGAFEGDRLMLIASSSKVLSVGVLMKLADDGLLDIDAPITDYLGDWGDYKTDITVAQLLSNSSGMVGLLPEPTYGPYLCQFLDSGTLRDCAESIYTADDEMDRVPPDTEFRYGGGQWQLAGGIAEVVSGKSWAQLIDEIYVGPCGLESTGFSNHFFKASVEGGGVDGAFSYPAFFSGDVADLPDTDNPSIEGGGYTVARDYAEVLLMHLRGGVCGEERVLSEAAVTRMQRDRILEAYGGSTTLDPTMQGYGLGWWVSREFPVISDAGAYGATPWLDLERRYGAMLMLEGEATQGALLRLEVQPILEEILDGRAD